MDMTKVESAAYRWVCLTSPHNVTVIDVGEMFSALASDVMSGQIVAGLAFVLQSKRVGGKFEWLGCLPSANITAEIVEELANGLERAAEELRARSQKMTYVRVN